VDQQVPHQQRPHTNEETELREFLTGSKVKELRNLGALACKISCKWKNRVKKVVMRLGGRGRTKLYVGSIGNT
jgi:hypothetical protein